MTCQISRRLAAIVIAAFSIAAFAGDEAWQARMNAGKAAQEAGDFQAALDAYVEAVKEAMVFGESDARLAAARAAVRDASIELAHLYKAQGRYTQAETIYRRALAFYERTLGVEHLRVATHLAYLAELLAAQGRFDDAEPLYRRAIAITERALGAEHASLASLRAKHVALAGQRADPLALAKAAYWRGEYAQAMQRLRELVEEQRADAEARFLIADMYAGGKGLPKDLAEALKWYVRAANSGWTPALGPISRVRKAYSDLGLPALPSSSSDLWNINTAANSDDIAELVEQCEQGNAYAQVALAIGVLSLDATESVKWLQKAARQGLGVAQFYLAVHYARGRGVAKDEAQALAWTSRAAAQGNIGALMQHYLGNIQREPRPTDGTELRERVRAAAEAGDAWSQFVLGKLLFEGTTLEAQMSKSEKISLGGFPRDRDQAMKWLRASADQGIADAQVALAKVYFSGTGVAPDLQEAARLFRKAADLGNAEAMLYLAEIDGRDAAKAEHWLRKAAEAGYPAAQLRLGTALFNGSGMLKDEKTAVAWLLRAAEHGQPDAHRLLAQAYAEGRGVRRNSELAAKWESAVIPAERRAGLRQVDWQVRYRFF